MTECGWNLLCLAVPRLALLRVTVLAIDGLLGSLKLCISQCTKQPSLKSVFTTCA